MLNGFIKQEFDIYCETKQEKELMVKYLCENFSDEIHNVSAWIDSNGNIKPRLTGITSMNRLHFSGRFLQHGGVTEVREGMKLEKASDILSSIYKDFGDLSETVGDISILY